MIVARRFGLQVIGMLVAHERSRLPALRGVCPNARVTSGRFHHPSPGDSQSVFCAGRWTMPGLSLADSCHVINQQRGLLSGAIAAVALIYYDGENPTYPEWFFSD